MPQFRIRTIMLLIAVTAVWTAYYTGRKSIERDLAAIKAIHALAPELLVRNQNEYACLQIDRTDDIREYQCYLPRSHQYKLQLLWSKEFSLYDKALIPEMSVTIAGGTRQVLLNELPGNLTVSVDGEEVINVPRNRPASRFKSSTGASHLFESQWYPLDQSLTLVRTRESDSGTIRNEAGPGIALWIEVSD